MATAKEIKGKMGSVKSTQKITRAMELIAASKMRGARQRMEMARPYAESARQIIRHVAKSHPEYRHPYLRAKTDLSGHKKAVGLIIVSSDRGLCGGLNINLFREVARTLSRLKQEKVDVKVAVLGQKAQNFIRQCDVEVLAVKSHLGDKPKLQDVMGSVQVMLDAFDQGIVNELYLFSNAFLSTVKQKPYQYQLLPIDSFGDDTQETDSAYWDYLYEPEAKVVLDQLLKRYIESQVYQGVIENIACEQASRMVAMKNATDNAGKMLQGLKLKYNKARQAAITQELAEIVSGADAQTN
jgi:F-type H+-transporting ATPase subunit gamma